ncbi:MAG: 50S ribosomal protein L9 [Bacillota bacterium]
MKLLLIENVKALGKVGDVKEVSDGYARNYLIPNKLAVAATEANLKAHEQRKKAAAVKEAESLQEAEEIKARLDQVIVTIATKAGDGRLYGSVTSKDIAQALGEQAGFQIDKHLVEIGKPIKKTGTYKVALHLYKGVNAEITVEVNEAK